MEGKSVEQLCDYLREEDVDEAILINIKKHKIDGSLFVQLSDEYLREIAPLLGDRLQLKNIITRVLDTPDVIMDVSGVLVMCNYYVMRPL